MSIKTQLVHFTSQKKYSKYLVDNTFLATSRLLIHYYMVIFVNNIELLLQGKNWLREG